MAVNRVPVLKRCRSLDLDPVFLGYDKKSKRKSPRAGNKSVRLIRHSFSHSVYDKKGD